MLLLLALLQSPGPTVGDTVWLEQTIRAPEGATLRAQPLEATTEWEPLAPPEVILRDGSAVIRHPVVFWRTGSHTVLLPGPIAIRPDGWSDTLTAARAVVEIRSILPEARRDTLGPRAAAAPLPVAMRSPIPVVVLVGLTALLLLPAHWLWRRRGSPGDTHEPLPPARPSPEQLDAWLAQGETAAALQGWAALLRQGSGDPGELEPLLRELEAARYGRNGRGATDDLVARARAGVRGDAA